jgi:hypothetical protein
MDRPGEVTRQEQNDLREIPGFGHVPNSASGIARRFAGVSMMLGRMEFTRTPVPLASAARESISATAAGLGGSIRTGAGAVIDCSLRRYVDDRCMFRLQHDRHYRAGQDVP